MADKAVPPVEEPRPPTLVSRPSATGDTVTVACKLEVGVTLRVFDWEKITEVTREGPKAEQRARVVAQYTVRGPWVASSGQAFNANNAMTRELLPGGYALTHGVPRDIWDRWLEQNQTSHLVQNNIIFAYPTGDTGLESAARKSEAVKSGMEPLDRANPGARLPGGVDRRLRLSVLDTGDNNTITR